MSSAWRLVYLRQLVVGDRPTAWARIPGMGFLREFIANPITTGSITPSSRHLARTIVEGLDLRDAETVLEYGPGTGVFTEFVLRELKPGAKFAAIELNPHFAEAFK